MKDNMTICLTPLEILNTLRKMVYQKQVFPLEKPAHFYIRMRARLSVLRSLVPIARIAFSMSVEHDAMGKLKKVLIFVSPRHIV